MITNKTDSTGAGRPEGEHITLTFTSVPSDRTPFAVRVRSLLKHALRSLGLRCAAIVSAHIEEPHGTPINAPEARQAPPPAPGPQATGVDLHGIDGD